MTTYQLLDADDKIFAEVADDGKIYRTFTQGDNSAYQAMREDVIANAGAALDVDVPDWLQADADQTLFDRQLAAYKTATARLAQYIVSVGRAEVVESQATGEQVYDEDTMEMVDVMHDVITVTEVEAVEATVTRLVYDETDIEAEPTEETIENPLITTDVSERDTAQAVVDATPETVKEAV